MYVKLRCVTLLFGLPAKLHICVEISRDQSFFEKFLPITEAFVTKAILPEISGQYFTRKPQQKVKKQPLSESFNTTSISKIVQLKHIL